MSVYDSPVSKANAEHYSWGHNCDGWYLVKNDELTVIQERMPPGTAESRHKPALARQFFFVLAGSALMEISDDSIELTQGHGLEVPPGVSHSIRNAGDVDLEFLVTSMPPSHGDRQELK
jgi:mannose-6-phosphate isomerase-like protein (cupin superfamily)